MSAEVAAPAAAAEAPANATEDAAPAAPAEEPDPFAGLNPVQRIARQKAMRKAAIFEAGQAARKAKDAPAPAEKPADVPPPAAAKDGAPERGPDGKFLPADGKPKAKEEQKPEGDSPVVEAAKEKAEDAGIKAPEQKESESDKQYALRISQLIRENKQAKAEALEHKAAREKAEAAAAKWGKTRERLSGKEIDEEAFLEATGRTFEQFVRAIAKGPDAEDGAKFRPKANLPPELAELKAQMDSELAELRAHKEELAAAKKAKEESEAKAAKEVAEQEIRDKDAAGLKGWIEERVEKYPYLSSLKNGEQHLRDEIYARWPNFEGPHPDIGDVAEMLENTLTDRLGTIFSSERAIMAALRDPKTRDMVSRALGTAGAQKIATDTQPQTRNHGQPKAATAEGPPTLSNKVPQESSVAVSDPASESAWVKQQRKEEEERRALHARLGPVLKQMGKQMNRIRD